MKPAGFYVQRSCGLFPAPRPQNNSDALTNIESLFSFIGIFFAKCIQDHRLIDLPLSTAFLKLMCLGDVLAANIEKHPMNLNDDVTMSSCDNITPTRDTPNIQDSPYIHGMALHTGVLTFEDFEVIDPHRAKFLRQLKQLVAQKQAIINDSTLGEDEQGEKLKALTLENSAVKLEHLR